MERLNRYLARSGVASRRGADELITSGSVLVNGLKPPESGLMVDPSSDVVTVDGKQVKPVTKHRYVVLNKPLGVVTTARDEAGRTSVVDLIGEEGLQGHRLFPVGRLDVDSTGLLLLTDDGDLAYRLTHPRFKVAKEYVVLVSRSPSAADLEVLRRGVELDDGKTEAAVIEVLSPAVASDRRVELRFVIREGRHRQVRRMLQALGHHAQALTRVGFGPLKLGRLKPGTWRVLVPAEVDALKRAVNAQ
jgi:23S rRNA pseudouridine2605 synthase